MQLRRIHVTGIVQGVGFRPFVYQLATRVGVCGWVANTSAGVDIELEGDPPALDAFVRALSEDKPPLARIDSLRVEDISRDGLPHYQGFDIRASVPVVGAFQPLSPDIGICPDCLRELFDPHDRRYRYPFINCTNCGPRFTIIRDIPYDRPLTTMRAFPMCAECAREYDDPLDRRFHAQPIACPRCGPHVWLESSSKFRDQTATPPVEKDEAIATARRLLAQGAIVAVKGLGGFHLACDATNERAVATLRDRKGRVDKPFALMAYDAAAVEALCYLSDAERALLESRERPIVLLRRRSDSPISDAVAPHNSFLGIMLPYTPLHYLLLAQGASPALVMSSGNYAEEPIATTNADAQERLANLADYFLFHNRDIEARADDSVVRLFEERELPLRRSRGYTPYPVHLPAATRPTLAVGAELKNTFCLTRDRYAFLSQHIGDLENDITLRSFEEQIEHFERLFRITPEILAYDLHPEYLATKYAKRRLETHPLLCGVPVQHHHAHMAACMAEHGLGDEPVLGVAFDGTGYGTDGAIWGGEFLIARYTDFARAAHLAYVPLPGGAAAIKRVYRSALAHLADAGVAWSEDLPCVAVASETERGVIRHQIETGLNAPQTSSMGRLFDAVAALIGVREVVNYEAQAAVELENMTVEDLTSVYAFEIQDAPREGGQSDARQLSALPCGTHVPQWTVSPGPVIRAIVMDYYNSVPPWVIATKFHNAVAELVRDMALHVRERHGLNRVVLSGGVFQNQMLLTRTLALLREAGFQIYTHHLVPPNDAGISLGQVAIAAPLARAK